jgi:hypothetical protein
MCAAHRSLSGPAAGGALGLGEAVGNQRKSMAARAARPLPKLVGTAAAHRGLSAPHPQRCRKKEIDGAGTSGRGKKETHRPRGRRPALRKEEGHPGGFIPRGGALEHCGHGSSTKDAGGARTPGRRAPMGF